MTTTAHDDATGSLLRTGQVADLLRMGQHRHGRKDDAGLQAQARTKLAEVEARIEDLKTIRTNLLNALDAGCDDLAVCGSSQCCPLPFADIATSVEDGTPG